MSMENPQKDDALFDALGKSKKKKKRRILRTVVIAVLVVAVVLAVGVSILQRNIRERFSSAAGEVLSYQATTGTISTVVSGSGTLVNVDTETVSVPTGVEVAEILVEYGDPVAEGDLLAIVDQATVRTAMSDLQAEIEELDEQISDAEGDKVDSYIAAGVSGRVKILYGAEDMDVAATMMEHGALAVISLDGYMAVEIQNDTLAAGDSVTVVRAEGSEISGTVESAVAGTVTVLVTDNGPRNEEEVSVLGTEGEMLGTGELYIHSPLAVTGYAGTISRVNVSENTKVSRTTRLFTLTDTAYSANYDALLRTRGEKEETLLELLTIQRNGGIVAPISGSVYTVSDLDSGDTTDIVTLSPDASMSVTISVDESDILSLEVGQTADVTVSSVSEEAFAGTVTEIDTSASSGYYTAVITLDKVSGMLPGMTAGVDVRIEGVDDAIIIPVEALHKTAEMAYVYTSYDSELQQYGGMVEVVAGLSNNNYVEIKSGLKVGDTVYYTETQSFADFFGNMGGFGGGRGGFSTGESGVTAMPSGGEMPDFGGNMPGDFGGGMPSGGMGGGRGNG